MAKEITVNCVVINENIRFREIAWLSRYVSETRQKRITRMKRECDKSMLLMTGLFIRYMVSLETGLHNRKIDIAVEKYGKPYLLNYAGYHFSVSNSSGIIAFASDIQPLGLDLEVFGKDDDSLKDIADNFFSPNETAFVHKSPSIEEGFFKIWTMKEAYLKYTGTGLLVPLDTFDVTAKDSSHNFFTDIENGRIITLCTGNNISGIRIEEVPIERVIAYFSTE